MTEDTQQARSRELHRRAIVIDGHSDILNPLADGRMRLADRAEVEPPERWQGAAFAPRHAQATPYQLSPYAMWFQCIGQYDIPRFHEGGPGYRAGLIEFNPERGTTKLKALAAKGGLAGVIFWGDALHGLKPSSFLGNAYDNPLR